MFLAVPIMTGVFILINFPVEGVTDLMFALAERVVAVGPLLLGSMVARRQVVRKAARAHYKVCLGGREVKSLENPCRKSRILANGSQKAAGCYACLTGISYKAPMFLVHPAQIKVYGVNLCDRWRK